VTDADNLPPSLTFTLVTIPTKGILRLGSTTLYTDATFTQANINNHNLHFIPDADVIGTDGFTFTVFDGLDWTVPPTHSFAITITEVNDPPREHHKRTLDINEGILKSFLMTGWRSGTRRVTLQ